MLNLFEPGDTWKLVLLFYGIPFVIGGAIGFGIGAWFF
jgi:hypothetical protein